ncbi:MAG: pyrimidine-nucleoside phosphorylase [Lachnospiraceae bacterium]|nr:pyrimidine-nucleoside phosphorylase [Lachnospiraceae bacterium]
MRMYDLITKKKQGASLTKEEINFIVEGFTNGTIPDYQMSAFLMAVCLKEMCLQETIDLTMAMVNSGDVLDLSPVIGKTADKHSTGGVGDKTSLIIGPMVAALGVPVAKMSGRGLGHTGGTIDKLESFPGFSVSLSEQEFFDNVNRIKLAITGQTANLAPADKKMYALRDVTATVDNLSLISSSIMSKKIAAGADVIVLDVKMGSGAFMKTLDEAEALAKTMVEIGHGVGRVTYAVLSDMSQPLGKYVGNALEVKEAIKTLKGDGPADLLESCLALASYMLLGVGRVHSVAEAETLLKSTITDGSALEKLAEFVEAQGGDPSYVWNPDKFPRTEFVEEIISPEDGYVAEIRTDEIGMTSLVLGGGRETKESAIDLSVGIKIHKKVGDYVRKGESIARLYANDLKRLKAASPRLFEAYRFSKERVEAPKHVLGIVTKDGVTRF